MTITYRRVQVYLDAIASNANLDAANSGHEVFWHQPYDDFVKGNIPTKHCNGAVVPIIDAADRTNSAFYRILQTGWCGMPQMPKTGPFVTDAGYSVTLSDGTTVTGTRILEDIGAWLEGGALEHG